MVVRLGPPRLLRRRWLANALFLVITVGPFIVLVWLVWPR
jgi:hypothetical protein